MSYIVSLMSEEERNGRELPEDPFSAVISRLNKKLIYIIKNQQLTDQEIQLFLSELETAQEQLKKIINELIHTFEHRHGYAEICEWKFRKTHELYTEQLNFYIPYYTKIINNVKDVVIFTNQNACLFQVSVKDIHFLFTIKDITYEYIRLVDRMAERGEEIIPEEFAVMDVYDTDDEYYYGICNGKKIFTPIDNTDKLYPDNGKPHSSLNYLVINDHFMNLLFTTDLSTDNHTIPHKLLLFEHGSAEFVKKSIFYDDSEFEDDLPMLRRMPAWIPHDAKKETFDKFTLFHLFLTKSKNYSDIFRDRWSQLITNYIWNIFFNLLTSNNNFHRTCALQNFKYFFIKSHVELNMLYTDINNYLTSTTQFTNMKLIDFFIPEIKFLLFHHFILQLPELPVRSLLSIQQEWNTYVQQYNFRFTSAKSHLYYLVTVLLKNIVNDKLYEKMLSKLDSLVLKIIRPMIPNTPITGILLLLKEQINKVIFNVFYKHAGGRDLSKKRSIKNKQKNSRKTSRK